MRALGWLTIVAGFLVLLPATGQDKQPKDAKPVLIVSDLKVDGDNLVIELQNQGPGAAKKGTMVEATVSTTLRMKAKDKKDKAKTKRVSITVEVPVPAGVFATETVKVPIAKLGAKNKEDLGSQVRVTLDPKKTLTEERVNNNTYIKGASSGKPPPRGDYKTGTELPDLVITDITQETNNLVIHYLNKGKGSTGADFLILVRSGEVKHNGNEYYRFRVPAPNTATKTGGLNLNLIGLVRGADAEVEATIDWEDRVRETDEKNNTFKKKIRFR
ncbi:MAG: hypothetical protein L0241_07540 [Planctomycetia bacterium]|nr:hypothetical protein [Planctomycetia bacterium]